jgi:hypothetical protein
MKILSDQKIFCRSEKKSPQKFTVMCIMFSLAFLECFTIVLAIGHLISPLLFIEVKVIQFLVFSVVQNCICYVFYSVCLEFCCFDDLVQILSERHWSVFNFIFKLHNFHCFHPFYTFPVSTKPICEDDHDWLLFYNWWVTVLVI